VFSSGSISLDTQAEDLPPVQIFVHSSDTGECPPGQSKYTLQRTTPSAVLMIWFYEYLSTLSELL
jgi:hypothetical protein